MAVYPFCKMNQSGIRLQTVIKMRKNLLFKKNIYKKEKQPARILSFIIKKFCDFYNSSMAFAKDLIQN